MALKPLIVIPARYASTRLPGKPLHLINGVPAIIRSLQAIYCTCSKCEEYRDYTDVVVATDNWEIRECIAQLRPDVEVMMTDPDHESGTDRMAEVAEKRPDYDIYLNVQGDMPFINYVDWINPIIQEMNNNTECDMCTPIAGESIVNATFNRSFVWRHVGVYGYRPEALAKYYAARTDKKAREYELEQRLEQLRAVSIGLNIKKLRVNAIAPMELNTEADLHALSSIAEQVVSADLEYCMEIESDENGLPQSDSIH